MRARCGSRWRARGRGGRGGRVGRGLDPGGRDGRSSSRRPGGPAPKRWQRRPGRPPVTTGTQPKPTASTGGDRWPWENIRVCGRLGDARTLRKRVEPQPRALPERGVSGGSKGGGALPLASPPRSTWRGLAYNPKSVSQPLGGAAEHASPGIARNSLDRAVARQLLGLPVASLKDGKGDRPGSRLSRDCATLCRAPGFRPTLTPPRPEIVR